MNLSIKREGFTLIEILVSVVLITIVIAGILKIREQQISIVHYIDSRMRGGLANTLFLKKNFSRYSGDEKSAYDLLHNMGIDDLKSREILKQTKRTLRVSDPLPLVEIPVKVQIRSFDIRDSHTAHYYRIYF